MPKIHRRKKVALSLLFLPLLQLVSCAKDSCPLDEVLRAQKPVCEDGLCAPLPPESGFGSAQVKHAGIETVTIEESFANSYRSFLYIPTKPKPLQAPVLLFLHGYFDATPDKYDAMLRYYASQGYLVIYPGYGNAIYAKGWADNADEAFRRALRYLETRAIIKPDRERIAYVGHSFGGILAFHLANRLAKAGDDRVPRVIVTTDAAGISTIAYPEVSIDDLSSLPKDLHLVMMMAEDTYKARYQEKDACENDSKADPALSCNGFAANLRVFQRTPQIPSENKQAFLIPSEKRGKIELRADHNSAQGECHNDKHPINSLDTWGYWRQTLTALDQALDKGSSPSAASSQDALTLGRWSDGKEATPIISLKDCLEKGRCPTL